ncbi:ATP-dependent helicase [Rhizobium sp. Root1204]|uniref:3'-5' exonuclease n=1 Tax=Rhizobium sp. Root1204 TaxID=1736428 RepID=UPI000A7FCFA3|nr:ATP-dependent helicase [Rhizobium sp. Root1204]
MELDLEAGWAYQLLAKFGTRAELSLEGACVRAAIHYGSGPEALNDCDRLEAEHGADPARLLVELMPLIIAASTDADALLKACRQAQSAAQFSELLDLDFARFNESLAATGSDPLTYPAVHASQLLNYIVEHEASILEALRNAAAPTLETFMPAPDYAQRRDGLRSMKAGPKWLTLYHFVPEAMLEEHVARWLERAGAPAIGANPHGLPDLADVRSANLPAIGRFATAATPIVRAWWKGPTSSIPDYWREAKAAEQHIRAKLDAAGVVDFKPMEEAVLIAWCVKLGLWPDGMGPTLDRDALGIGADAIDAAAKEAHREAEERAAKARSVRVNDRDVDPEHADWTEISAEIAARLSKQVKSARLTTPTELALLKKRTNKPTSNLNPRDVPPGPDRTPQAKKDMIGRLGELVVYHWLKDRFRNQDIDKAWVSRFGALQKSKAWSDDLGYDFELTHDRRTWLIEVKSRGGIRLFAVGDADQSIYTFAGANPALLESLTQRPGVQVVKLRFNYRSGGKLIKASLGALGQERDYRGVAGAPEGEITFWAAPMGLDTQAETIATSVIPHLVSKGIPHGEIAVLYRAAWLGDKVAAALKQASIPFVRTDTNALVRRSSRIARFIEDCAKWATGGWRDAEPPYSRLLSQATVLVFGSYARELEQDALSKQLIFFLESSFSSATTHAWLQRFERELIVPWRALARNMEEEWEICSEMISATDPAKGLDLPLAQFAGRADSAGRVTLSTLHSAKGREFDGVIMYGVNNGDFPNKRDLRSDTGLREARRSFYVGVTRPRKELCLVFQEHHHSPWVQELYDRIQRE